MKRFSLLLMIILLTTSIIYVVSASSGDDGLASHNPGARDIPGIKGSYLVGGSIVISIPAESCDITITLNDTMERFKYYKAEKTAVFYPKKPGNYNIIMVCGDNFYSGSFVVNESSPLTISDSFLSLGDELLITINDLKGSDKLYVIHGSKKLRFMGSQNSVFFRPSEPGSYEVLLLRDGRSYYKYFTVSELSAASESVSSKPLSDGGGSCCGSGTLDNNTPPVNSTENLVSLSSRGNHDIIDSETSSGTSSDSHSSNRKSLIRGDFVREPLITWWGGSDDWEPVLFIGDYNDKSFRQLKNELLSGGSWMEASGGVRSLMKLNEYARTQDNTVQKIKSFIGIKKNLLGSRVDRAIISDDDDELMMVFENPEFNQELLIDKIPGPEVFSSNGLSIKRSFELDPSKVSFSSGILLARAKGRFLFKCEEWDYNTKSCNGYWKVIKHLTPGEYYEVELGPYDPAFVEAGLSTLNTDKPVYHPGETAGFTAAVLDGNGYLVRNATVVADIVLPDNSSRSVNLSGTHPGIYQANFTTSVTGSYLVTLNATSDTSNSSFITYFNVRDYYPYDIVRSAPTAFDPWSGFIKISFSVSPMFSGSGPISVVEELPINFSVNISDHSPDYIIVTNSSKYLLWLGNSSPVSSSVSLSYEFRAPLVTPELYFLRSYVINVSPEMIANNLLINSSGNSSEKTLNNTFFVHLLNSSYEEERPWFLAADPVVDPNNAGDIDMTAFGDHKIVFSWYDTGDSDISFEIWDTNGTRIVDEVDVDTSAGTNSRVAVDAISTSSFALSYIDSSNRDLYNAIYDSSGNLAYGVADIDTNVGANNDVGVAELGSRYVICNANDADNDADYRIFNNDGSSAVGESNVDGNMLPQAAHQNLVDCDAISSNRWVYAWFDDRSNDITLRLVSDTGTAITAQTDIDTNVGETGQVAVAGSGRHKAAAVLFFDSSNNDIYLAVYNLSSDSFSALLSPTSIDANAGSSSRVSIDEMDYKGDSYWVASWQDTNSGDIKAAIYTLNGTEFVAPFSAINDESGTYQLIDVEGTNTLLNTGLCSGVFVIGYTTSSASSVFTGFLYDGSSWNGVCPNFVPDHNSPLIISELGYNETSEDLLCLNQSTSDFENDPVINVYDWIVNGSSVFVLNVPFENGNSSWTKDYSVNNNDGVVSGASYYPQGSSECKYGGCYYFDGANDQIRFQGDNLSTSGGPFTVSFWFNPSSTIDSSISSNIALIEKREGAGSNDWLVNFQTTDSGRMRWRSYTGNVQTQTSSWSAGTWYFVTLVYRANNNATIYVNGVEDNNNGDYNIGTLTQSTEDIFVGTRYDSSQDFNGYIDELRIFNKALSPDEINKLYSLEYSTLSSYETGVSDQWSCAVTPADPFGSGTRKVSGLLTVLAATGSPPNITSVSDVPDPVSLGGSLNISAVVTDPDNNLDQVWVNINGSNYTMSNTGGDNYLAQIDTSGFATGLQTYVVYANDTAGKSDSMSGTVVITNTISVDVSSDKSSYYVGDSVNTTTHASVGQDSLDGASVTTAIIKINSSSELVKNPWWDSSWRFRSRFTITDTSGVDRNDYWVSVPVVLDSDCSLDAHNNSLRLVDDDMSQLPFLAWNITTCSDSSYTKSLWVSFRLNLSAGETRDFYIYYDNSTSISKVASERPPWHIIYPSGGGNGNPPDVNDLQTRYDNALQSLGISSTGFYKLTSTSANADDIPSSLLTPYPYVHYASGSKYQRSWYQNEASNIYSFVSQSGSVFLTGQDLGYDANRDGWIYNNAWINLTHMTAGWSDDSGDPTSARVSSNHPVTQYLGSSGTTFTVSPDWFDGYTSTGGVVEQLIIEWVGSSQPDAGTANNGLFDPSCSSSGSYRTCGKTVYFGGMLMDTSGNGISSSSDRENLIKGVIDWFLNNRNASVSYGKPQEFILSRDGITSSGSVSVIFNSSSWDAGIYAAASNVSKAGYNDGLNFTTFSVSIDYSNYPNITSVFDDPDPIPLGNILNITASVSDSDSNINQVWVNINGSNYTMAQYSSSGTVFNYYVEINTTGFSLGSHTYTVYANDSNSHDAAPESGTVEVSNAFQVSTSTDKPEYVIGESVTATSQTYLGFQPTSANVVVDIIKGVTDTPWWDNNWTLRKKLALSSPDSTDRVNEIVRVNITGLNGNITNCANQLRIIRGEAEDDKVETPFSVEYTDNSNWCYVRFLANISSSSSTIYYVYYNNTGASSPGYSAVKSSYLVNPDMESTTGWTYYENEPADSGAYSTTTYNSPSTSYDIYSGSSATIGNYAEIYQDVMLPCSSCDLTISAYNRLESAGSTADAFRAQLIVNSTMLSNIGTPPSGSSPIDWTKRSGTYTASGNNARIHLRMLSDVTYTGGGYARRDVYWDDVEIKTSYAPSVSLGSEEQYTDRKSGTTSSSNGLLDLVFNSSYYLPTNYSAVSLASKGGYNNDTSYAVFLMKINTSSYPQINSVNDTPDPVLYGNNINFTVNVTDDSGVSAVWITIDGATNITLSHSSGDLWVYSLSTSGYANGDHQYLVYANDTESHTASDGPYTFTVAKKITVLVTGDKSSYTTGDLAVFTTNATLSSQLPGATSTNDIIMGTTERSWWNANWHLRKPLAITEPEGFAKNNAILEVNLSGLSGSISNCNEVRIVDYKDNPGGSELDSRIFGGDNSSWCLVRFYANISSGESSSDRIYAYYNNTGAPPPSSSMSFQKVIYDDDGENVTLQGLWTRDPLGTDGATSGWWDWDDPQNYQVGGVDAQPENDVTAGSGVNALFTGPTGDNTGTGYQGDVDGGKTTIRSKTLNLSGWSNVTISFYRWFYSNDNGGNNDDTCAMRASIDNGTNFNKDIMVLHDDDVGADTDYYNSWQQVSYDLASKVGSLNGLFVLLAEGDDYGDGDVVECGFDEILITAFVSNVSVYQGSEEIFIQRTTNTTGTDGTAKFFFNTAGQSQGNYVAISLVNKSPYDSGSDGFPFSIAPDAAPSVTLVSPSNNTLTNSRSITFQCSATDDFNLDNITLYNDLGGSWGPNGTVSASGTSDSASFPRTALSDGTYYWNCLAYDNISQGSFGTNNFSITVDTLAPEISIFYPQPGFESDTSSVLFAYSSSDIHGITSCSLIINGSTVSTDTSITDSEPSYFSTSLSNGYYLWNISCTDGAGNTNTTLSRPLVVNDHPVIRNGTLYERSWYSCNNNFCAIILNNSRNSSEHSQTKNPVEPSGSSKAEAASYFMGSNGAFISSGSVINFSGEFLTNPVSEGLVSWSLYRQGTSLSRALICEDTSNPLFSQLTGSCNPGDTYLRPDELLMLVVTFSNDESHNISYTHYWDSLRNSFVDINLTTVGYLNGSITKPPTDTYSITQGAVFELDCTYNCTLGSCPETSIYAEYDDGTGYKNISSSGGLYLNGSQTNPVSLGMIINGSNKTALFYLVGNETNSYSVRCRAEDVAESSYTNELTLNVGDNTAPVVALTTPLNDTFVNTDPAAFSFWANDSSGIQNCTLFIDGQPNTTSSSITENTINTISSSLTTGSYTWGVECYDDGGLLGVSNENHTVHIDSNPPSLIISSPLNAVVDSSYVTFNFTASDDWNSNLTCNITIDGSNTTYSTNNLTAYNGMATLYDKGPFSLGQHFYNVTCWDLAMNINTSATFYFNITDSAPSVSLQSPANNSLTASSSPTLVYVVTENNALQYCDLYIDGLFNQRNSTIIDLGHENNFTASGLSDGTHNWTVLCNDSSGQYDMPEPWLLTVDSTPPAIGLIGPSNGSEYTTTSDVTISFNATDLISSQLGTNITCNLTINSALNESLINLSSGDTYSTPKNGLGDNYYYWNVTCSDNAGNANTSETWVYTINNTPQVYLVSPLDGGYTKSSVNFTYFADDNDELSVCRLFIDGSQQSSETEVVEGANNQFSVSGLTEGSHSWYVSCTDSGAFSNQNITPSRQFTVDISPPLITLNSPLNGTIINASNATLNWTADDNYASSMVCNITLDGSLNSSETVSDGLAFAKTINGLANGWHYWNITCSDDAGNTNTSVTWEFFNNVPPSVYLQAPANMTFNNTGSWDLVYEPVINDPYAESAYFTNCSLYLDGLLNQTDNSPLRDQNNTFSLSGVDEGLHYWKVVCYEDSGARGDSDVWDFVEDETTPSPNITTNNNTWFSTPTPTISFNISDNLGYDVDYFFFVDGLPDSSASGSVIPGTLSSDTLSSLSEGSHSVILEGVDKAGNRANSTQLSIMIDYTPPSVFLLSPDDGITVENDTITFNWSVDELLSPNASCDFYLDYSVNKSYSILSFPKNISEVISGLSPGYHYWSVSCTDHAGNINNSPTRSFFIPVPDLVINSGNISFSNSTPREGQNITINATVWNLGNSTADNFVVQFWLGDPENGGSQLGSDHNVASLPAGNSTTISINYTAVVGQNDIYVLVDTPLSSNGSVNEANESNNKAFNGFQVGFYNIFSGLTNNYLKISDSSLTNLWSWNVSNATGSNILVTDEDSSVDFTNLVALGRGSGGSTQFEDFAELDSKLGSTGYPDSINATWTSGGSAKRTADYTVFNNLISNVPVVNSTNTSSFTTGILWDASDGGSTYDGSQDVVFISQINQSHQGSRGVYDYEIRVPATLRSYTGSTERVTFYTEVKG